MDRWMDAVREGYMNDEIWRWKDESVGGWMDGWMCL
jgi:hypothetical protein